MWKCTFRFSAEPNRWTTTTAPVDPPGWPTAELGVLIEQFEACPMCLYFVKCANVHYPLSVGRVERLAGASSLGLRRPAGCRMFRTLSVLIVLIGCGSAPTPEPVAPPPQETPDKPPAPAVATPPPEAPDSDQGSAAYACPMHPAEQSVGPGECSKCGMAMVKQEVHDHGSHDHGDAPVKPSEPAHDDHQDHAH